MADLRQPLEDMLRSIDGIKSASGWPTENVGAQPFAFVGFDDDAITAGNLELDLHTVDVTVLVDRKSGNLPNQIRATESLVDDFKAAVRANQDLGLPTQVGRVQYLRIREGVYQYAGVDYVGFIATLQIKEMTAVSYG